MSSPIRPGVFRLVGYVRPSIAILIALLVFGVSSLLAPAPVPAQGVGNLLQFPPRPAAPPKPAAPTSDTPMLLQATEIRYDYTNNTVSAVGSVQIYYNGSTVEADEVTYDQKSKRLQAHGNVRLTEADGKITYGQFIDLTDDYRDGFVDALRVETIDDTRFAAARADRVQGKYTVLQNGVYTACEACKEDPKKPPLWQIQAARIIHDSGEKMIYFEDARVEFFGVPLAYFPFLSAPDPSVTRKSGFLFPNLTYSTVYTAGIEIPYFWAVTPSSDLTTSVMATWKEGELFQGVWRQRLLEGSYSIKAAGIFQTDPGYFASRDGPNSPTANSFRGAIQTAGQFALSDKWVWGWTGLLMTDTQFLFDYQLSQFIGSFDPFHTGVASEGVSQLYLSGAGDRSYFDIRSIYYYGFSGRRRPIPDPGHSPGAGLFKRARAADPRRRTRLQGEPDQPDPAAGRIRCDQLERLQQPAVRSEQSCHHQFLELPVARHRRHLHALFRRGGLAAHVRHRRWANDHAVRGRSWRRRRIADAEPAGHLELHQPG